VLVAIVTLYPIRTVQISMTVNGMDRLLPPQRVSLQWLAPAKTRRSSHGTQSRYDHDTVDLGRN